MNVYASAITLGLLLSLPLGMCVYILALSLEKASGARPDRVWSLALVLASSPLLIAPVIVVLANFWPSQPSWTLLETLPFWPADPVVTDLAVSESDAVQGRKSRVGILLVWLLGAGCALGIEAMSFARLRKVLRHSRVAPPALVADIKRRAPLNLEVRTVDAAISPFLCGILRPRLILPVGFRVLPHTLLILDHEFAHLSRRDLLTGFIWRLASVAFWFNPVWRAIERRRRIAVEMACDAVVMRRASPDRARSYARALLDTARANSGFAPTVGFGVTHKEALEMRLKSILTPSSSPKWRRLGLGAFAAMLALACSIGVQAAQATGTNMNAPVFSRTVLEGRFTSGFGPRALPEGAPQAARNHGGVDVAAPLGSDVHAPAPGRVVYVGDGYHGASAWGHVIEIDHGSGWSTVYAHLGDMHVSVNDRVTAGDVIAEVGMTGLSTGPHVHIEVRLNGERVDPQFYLPGLDRASSK